MTSSDEEKGHVRWRAELEEETYFTNEEQNHQLNDSDYDYEDDFEDYTDDDSIENENVADDDDDDDDDDCIDGVFVDAEYEGGHKGEKDENHDYMIPDDFENQQLDHGIQLIVPANDPNQITGDCSVEPLSAQERTELFSKFNETGDEVLISDAYEIVDRECCFSGKRSRSWLLLPLVLPKTRLDHDDLFSIYVMGKRRNDVWKKIPSIYMECKLQIPLKGLQLFYAYAQLNQQSIDVTSYGIAFKSKINKKMILKIPKGAVKGTIRMVMTVHPVYMERLNSYKMDPRTFNRIYSLTDILCVRHTMENVLKRRGSVRLPSEREMIGQDIKCLTKTSHKVEVSNIYKTNQAIAYTGDNETSFQVARVKRGITEDTLIRDAAYLTGQLDSCNILYFLSKEGNSRYLTVEIVDKPMLDKVSNDRWQQGYIEIGNSRLCDVDLRDPRRVQVVLGGNVQSYDHQSTFMFIYSSSCINNYVDMKISRIQYHHDCKYSSVKVKFNDRKVHEIHFDYPDEEYELKKIQNTYKTETHSVFQGRPRKDKTSKKKEKPAANAQMATTSRKESRASETSRMESRAAGTSKIVSRAAGISRMESRAAGTSRMESRAAEISRMESRAAGISRMESRAAATSRMESIAAATSRMESRAATSRMESSKPQNLYHSSGYLERDTPLLEQASLLALGKNIEPEVVSDLMVMAGFRIHMINEIRMDAKRTFFNPNMRLLQAWTKKMKNEMKLSGKQILDRLEKSFKEIGRADIADIIHQVRHEGGQRTFMSKDFDSV